MNCTSTASTRTAKGLLWAIFGVNVYRAATQSITGPEAQTYLRFVHPQLKKILSSYDANNHVLNTYLAKLSLKALPLSEFSLRVPSLLCGGLYLWAVWRIARRAFGTGAMFLAAVAVLTLNPLVLDSLSAARGYGMAMAFWMWALDFMLAFLGCSEPAGGRERYLNRAGLCLTLSVAGSISFFYPALALGITFWIAVALRKQTPMSAVVERFLVPGAVAALLLLALPLAQANAESLYSGGLSLRATVHSLIDLSFFRGGPGAESGMFDAIVRVGLAIFAALSVGIAIRFLRRPAKIQLAQPVSANLITLTGGTMAFSFVLMIAARHWLRTPYPSAGSALFFIPVPALAALALVTSWNWKPASRGTLVLAAGLSAIYLLQVNIRRYGEWPEDAESESMISALVRDAGAHPIRIGASAAEEPVVNFYRERYRLRKWAPAEPKLDGNFDYFVLGPHDDAVLRRRRFTVVYRDLYLTLTRPEP